MFDFSAERTLQSVDESLARLGVEYVDIIQVTISQLRIQVTYFSTKGLVKGVILTPYIAFCSSFLCRKLE